MKRILFVASLLVMIVTASMVMADTVKVDRWTGYYSGEGGEFTLSEDAGVKYAGNYAGSASNVGGTTSFQSFCVETNEDVISNRYDFVPNTGAVNGGAGGGNPDPVSIGTAWLYYQFSKGTLPNYTYDPTGGGRAVSAGLLQNTIWWLEGEGDSRKGSTNIFGVMVKNKFGDYATADNGGIYGYYPVGILNLTETVDGVTYRRQDQLVTVSTVPIPPTLYLLGAGLAGFVGLRRKFGL